MRKWFIVPLSTLEVVWQEIEPWIVGACKRSGYKYTPDGFLESILQDKAQLWIGVRDDAIEAAALTDIIEYPNKRYARVTVGMGNNPQDLESFISTFEAWAHDMGCHGVQSSMRPGFAPQFKRAGWKQTHVTMEREF